MVRPKHQRLRNRQAECLRGLDRSAPCDVRQARTQRDESAVDDGFSKAVHDRQPIVGRKVYYLAPVRIHQAACGRNDGLRLLLSNARERLLQILGTAKRKDRQPDAERPGRRNWSVVIGRVVFREGRRRTTRESASTSSLSISRYLGSKLISVGRKVTPVKFHPGRGRPAMSLALPVPPA